MKRSCFKGCFGSKAGFTLIELLVVVLIIGILAAVAVPQYRKAVYKSRATEALAMLKTMLEAQEVYFLANGTYTNDISKLDVDIPEELIVAEFGGTDVDKPNTYVYSCHQDGTCAANAANEDMPLFQYTGIGHPNEESRGNFQCGLWKKESAMAESICQSMGTFQKKSYGYNYYKIN